MEVRITTQDPRSGIILIVVLFLIILLAVIILQFQFSVTVENRIAEHRVHALKGSYNLRSKIELAKLSIIKDVPLRASETEPDEAEDQAIDAPPPEPGEMFGLTVYDASSRININNIVDGRGKPVPAVQAAVKTLLSYLDIDPDVADAFIDYIDRDKEGEYEDGALNRPFHNLTEIALVNKALTESIQLTPEVFRRREKPEDPPSVYDYFTVHSKGRININTAPAEVLVAILSNPAYEEAVENIIEERETVPFKNTKDIYKVEQASRGMFGSFARNLTTAPTIFIVEAEDTQGNITRRGRAVFEKRRTEVRLLFYHEE